MSMAKAEILDAIANMTVLELSTAPGDMGKIIGRQGRTAAALRMLVALTAERHGKRAQLDIKD